MTTQTVHAGQHAGSSEFLATVSRAVAAIALGLRASHDWHRLSAMSDAALAHEGLTREQIGRAVFERNFR